MSKLDIATFKPSDEITAPFGLKEEDFIPIEKVLDEAIIVHSAQIFANDKGPGVYIGFTFAGKTEMHYTTTHAVNLVKVFGSEAFLKKINEEGASADCRIFKRASKSDKSKTVYDVE